MQENNKIPLYLLAGFLGSGKTTLLHKILTDKSLQNTAVLINEFGDIGLDHHIIKQVHDQVTLLSNGCVCCNIREDLKRGISDLLTQQVKGTIPPFERIILETSGVAEPAPILYTLENDYVLKANITVASIIMTIDCTTGQGNLAEGDGSFGFDIEWGGKGIRKIYSFSLPKYPGGVTKEVDIKLQFTILPDGTIGTIFPKIKADTRLENAAINSLRQWRFEALAPSQKQDEQTAVIVFPYRLQ